jgi:hypothetical protein
VFLYRLESASTYCFVEVTGFSNLFQYRLEISISGWSAGGSWAAEGSILSDGGGVETL